jgi:endonuclease YncB( thermonuclease family)
MAFAVWGSAAAADSGVYDGPYDGTVLRVVDGDNFVALVNIWPTIRSEVSVRIAGIDAPETNRPNCELEREYGEIAASDLRERLPVGTRIQIETVRADSFHGRVVADACRMARTNCLDIALLLMNDGIVQPWTEGEADIDWCAVLAEEEA